MKEILLVNPENIPHEIARTWRTREAARAVVYDSEGKIALLHVASEGYYKLPGGGIESGKDRLSALQRECKEEIGCEVDVLGEVGTVIEYIEFCSLKQTSYCYLAKVKGLKSRPEFTEDEATAGFEQVWLTLEDAVSKVSGSKATTIEGEKYIKPRDTALLEAAQKVMNN